MLPFGIRLAALLGPAALFLFLSCAVRPPAGPAAWFAGAAKAVPAAWSDEPVIVLADTVDIGLAPGTGRNLVRHVQTTWYYVNRRNPTTLERIMAPEFGSIEQTPDIQATAYYPDGSSWSPGPAVSRVRYAEAELHSSDRWLRSFRFPRYVQGMIVRLRIARAFHRPEFLKSELLRDEYPALERVVRLSLPKAAAIRHGLVNPEGLALDTARSEDGEARVFTVRGAHLAKLDDRTMPRNPEAWLAAVHFSLPAKGLRSASWAELGDDYLAAIEHSFQPTPDLEKLAASLPREKPDSLVRRVYSLLRARIRYHADLEILHAFVPRPAGRVLAKGYGDCKEMSTLMTQILRMKGVKAGVALVSTPGSLQAVEAFPSLGGFNHMIVYAELPGGEIRFFDPTVKHGDPADSYYALIDRAALALRGGKSALAPIPMGPGYRNRVETRSLVRRGAGGKGWDLVGSIRLEGRCAFSLLPALNAAMGEEKTPLVKTLLKELFEVEADQCRLVAATDRGIEVAYEASFNSHYLDMDKGGLRMAWPSLFGGGIARTGLEREGPRHVMRLEQSDTWEIPPGFDELEKQDLEHAFARGAWSRKGATLRRTYAAEASVVPADRREMMADYERLRTRFGRATLWRR